jgi:hypothetical protein
MFGREIALEVKVGDCICNFVWLEDLTILAMRESIFLFYNSISEHLDSI